VYHFSGGCFLREPGYRRYKVGYGLKGTGSDLSRGRDFSFSKMSFCVVVCGSFSRRQIGRGVKLTTHILAVPRLRKSGGIFDCCKLHGVDRDNFTSVFLLISFTGRILSFKVKS
jgi:hypothetical protein